MPIPDIQASPNWDGQSVPDAVDFDNFSRAFNASGLVSGCVTTAYGAPAMGVQISAGSVVVNGVTTAVSAASVTIQTASTSDRRDIIVANSSGSVYAVMGTPCGTAGWTRDTYPGLPPVKPNIPSGAVFLADIYVEASLTAIASGDIEINSTKIRPYVQTFNGRSASVSFLTSDLFEFMTAAGQLYIGTGSGTGETLTAGSVGTVLTSQGATSVPQWLPQTGSGAASAGVTTYNSRFGIVTSQASDVEGLFTTAGQMFVGTGSGTGELLTAGSVHSVLVGNGSASVPSWQPVAPLVESGFTTAGQLYVGTGSGTGELFTAGSVNTVLVGLGAASVPSWKSHAAAIESTFTAAGQLYVGTGSGTGELLAPGTDDYVLTSNGTSAVPSWQASGSSGYPLSTPVSGTLSSSYTLTSTPTVIMTTPSLANGTWLIILTAAVGTGEDVGNFQGELYIAEDSATATFGGPTQAIFAGYSGVGAISDMTVTVSCLATITSPGTLAFEANGVNASINEAPFTGWTATRVA